MFLGALWWHSTDIPRLQRLINSLLVTLLFLLLVSGYTYDFAANALPACLSDCGCPQRVGAATPGRYL